jgi:iron complex transport system permease protein
MANGEGFAARRTFGALILLGGLVLITGIVSLGIGRFTMPPQKVVSVVACQFMPCEVQPTEVETQVILAVRLPRMLLAAMAGAGLALSGAALQGVFRNPLVGPHIIGVSSGSALGGTLAILLGLSSAGLLASSFGFGILALGLVYAMTNLVARRNVLMLVLAGVIVGGFFSALVSLVQYLADTEEKLPSIVFWLLGSFATANTGKLVLLGLPLAAAASLLLALRWRINLLSLGDEDAQALGIPVDLTRWTILALVTLIVSAQVAVSGVIGWVGLVVPHLARMLVGPDHRVLLPASMLIGAAYMLLVDDIARILTSAEIPLGIITALIGAPIFGLLLRKTQGRGAHD